jgi:hypothetical protein
LGDGSDIADPEVLGVDWDVTNDDGEEEEGKPPDGFTVVTWTGQDFSEQLKLLRSNKNLTKQTSLLSQAPLAAVALQPRAIP